MLTQSKKKAVQWEGLRPRLHIYALFNPILQGYESVSIDPDDFEGKVVLILGRGDPILTIVVYYCYKKDMPFLHAGCMPCCKINVLLV